MRGGPPGMMGRGHRGAAMGFPPGGGNYNRGFDRNRGFDAYEMAAGPPSMSPGSTGYGPAVDSFGPRGPFSAGMMGPPSRGPPEVEQMTDDRAIDEAIEMQPRQLSPEASSPDAEGDIHAQPHALTVDHAQQPLESPTSVYSPREVYVPPRAGWAQGAAFNEQSAEPTGGNRASGSNAPSLDLAHSASGNNYYEDVDPRFAEAQEPPPENARVPSALLPGPVGESKFPESIDDLSPGARSPASSETSHFTSISERPVNPRWRPPPLPAQQQRAVLLENNPDFELGPVRGRGGLLGNGSRMPPLPMSRDATRYPLP